MQSRRRVLAASVAAFGASGTGGCLGLGTRGPASVDSSPTSGGVASFQYDGGNRGWSDANPPTDDPRVAWRQIVPPSIAGQPVVRGERVALLWQGTLVTYRSTNGGVATTAEFEWSAKHTPAIVGETLYVPIWKQDPPTATACKAISLADGTVRWSVDGGGQVTPAGDGVVLGGYGTEQLQRVGSDGEKRWTRDLGGFASGPAFVDGTTTIGLDTGAVRSYGPDGTERWTRTVRGDVSAAPTVAPDGTAFVLTQAGRAYRISPEGDVRWETGVADGTNDSATLADGTLYVPTGDAIVALDTADGSEEWRTEEAVDAAMTAANDTLYGTNDAEIVALDRSNGKRRWTLQVYPRRYSDAMLSTVRATPVAVGETLFVAADTGELFAIRAR